MSRSTKGWLFGSGPSAECILGAFRLGGQCRSWFESVVHGVAPHPSTEGEPRPVVEAGVDADVHAAPPCFGGAARKLWKERVTPGRTGELTVKESRLPYNEVRIVAAAELMVLCAPG
jgi:hypothetical protein